MPRAVSVLLTLRMNLVWATKCCDQWTLAGGCFSTEIETSPGLWDFQISGMSLVAPISDKTKARHQRHLFRSIQSTVQNVRLWLDAVSTPSATALLKGIFAEENVTLKR